MQTLTNIYVGSALDFFHTDGISENAIKAHISIICKHMQNIHAWMQRGDRGVRIPPGKSQKYRVSKRYILVRIPFKITKLPSQHSMLGHHFK